MVGLLFATFECYCLWSRSFVWTPLNTWLGSYNFIWWNHYNFVSSFYLLFIWKCKFIFKKKKCCLNLSLLYTYAISAIKFFTISFGFNPLLYRLYLNIYIFFIFYRYYKFFFELLFGLIEAWCNSKVMRAFYRWIQFDPSYRWLQFDLLLGHIRCWI